MPRRQTRGRSPPPALLRRLLDHQRWLNSDGRFGAQLVQSELEFVNCDLAGMNFSQARIDYAYFEGGSLKGACFAGAMLRKGVFDGCDLEGTDFRNADLSWANFLTDVDKAIFEGADLTRTAWNRKQMDQNNDDDTGGPQRPKDKFWVRGNKLEPG